MFRGNVQDSKLVAIELKGGLGNQLFQFAAAWAVAQRLDIEQVTVDLSWFGNSRAMQAQASRMFALGAFDLPMKLWGYDPDNPDGRKRKAGAFKRNRANERARIVSERSFRFDRRVLAVTPPVLLTGYFQSENYFSSISNLVRDRYSSLTHVPHEAQATIEALKGNSLAIHVRRGDYLSNPTTRAFHGLLPLDYYRRAISHIESTRGFDEVLVFSDDPEWVRSQGLFRDFRVCELGSDPSGAATLWVMTACDHFVIANSSFSWWAAWLGRNPEKLVVAPEPWFQSRSLDEGDLLPTPWIRLKW